MNTSKVITQGAKEGRHYTIIRGHIGFTSMRTAAIFRAMNAYARFGLRGKHGESYVSLHNDKGYGRFPVTVTWRNV